MPRGIPSEKTICPSCQVMNYLEEGEYTECCGHIAVTMEQFGEAILGKIPKIRLRSSDHVSGRQSVKRSKSKKDLESGIRSGTMKYRAYILWKEGKSIKHIVKVLKAKNNSVRSWVSRFNKRYVL